LTDMLTNPGPGIKPAIAYAFLTASQSATGVTSTGTRYSPKFIDVKLNNALVNRSKDLYTNVWRLVPNKRYPNASVGFFKANMTREETEALLKKKPEILVITPGKLMDLLENKITLNGTKKICFDPLNALLIYKLTDKPIQEILQKLDAKHHIIALTTSLSERLHNRFKQVTSAAFGRNLKDMIHFNEDRVARLKWLVKHMELVPTKDRKVSDYPSDKVLHALLCLMEPKTREAQFADRPILAICNYKDTLRQLKRDADTLFDEELPIFHGGKDLDDTLRWANLTQFEELDSEILACTRRSMYGCRFDFLPAFLVVEFPKSWDEWLHIMQW
jgi:superfamily II DNA/RNA helicase